PSDEPGAVGAEDDALRPRPGLADVPALVDRVRTAGLPVEFSVAGTPRGVPQGMDLAAYRVAQEALTNVIKHADQAQTACASNTACMPSWSTSPTRRRLAPGPAWGAVAAAGSSACGSG